MAFTFTSCSKKDANRELSINQNTLATGTSAFEQEISITSNAKWTVRIPAEAASWVSADRTTGESNGKVKIILAANTGPSPRNTSLTISSEGLPDQQLSISQKGLIEWSKTIPNNINSQMVELADGYVLAGQQNRQMYIYKVSKTDFSLMKSYSVSLTGYDYSVSTDLEVVPGGGVVVAGRVENHSGNPIVTNAYFLHLGNNLELIKDKLTDFGGASQVSPTAVLPVNNGFVVAYEASGGFVRGITKLTQHLERIPELGEGYPTNLILDMKAMPNGDIVTVGGKVSNLAVMKFKNNLDQSATYYPDILGRFYSLSITPDNKIAVCGYKRATAGNDIFALRMDADLNPITNEVITINKAPGKSGNYAYSIFALSNGGYALSGTVSPNDEDRGYTVQIDSDFKVAPGKEVLMPAAQLKGVIAGLPLAEGGYLIIGPPIGSDAVNTNNIVRINP